jgi:hypothetical protein
LSTFYDNDRIEIPIIDIIRDNINIQNRNLISTQSNVFKQNTDKMINLFKMFVEKEKKHVHLFDEEFEIELEVEQEEEFEVQRPNNVDSHVPSIHTDVFDFVINGNLKNYSENFIHLPFSLKDSSLKNYLQENAWSSKLFVTKDFLTTVKYHLSDDFLRPPKWIATSSNNVTVVLSAFETNELVKYFDKSKVKLSYLLPRNRKDQKRLFESYKSEIVISPLHMEQLAVYSGSLYLNDEHEQSTFLSFSGYCPSPRTKHEEKLFNLGHITRTGYVYGEYRAKLGLNDCGFVNDPMPMVKRLAEIRNYGIVPNSAYHLVISNTGEKP